MFLVVNVAQAPNNVWVDAPDRGVAGLSSQWYASLTSLGCWAMAFLAAFHSA